jgi:hypothetical protein
MKEVLRGEATFKIQLIEVPENEVRTFKFRVLGPEPGRVYETLLFCPVDLKYTDVARRMLSEGLRNIADSAIANEFLALNHVAGALKEMLEHPYTATT